VPVRKQKEVRGDEPVRNLKANRSKGSLRKEPLRTFCGLNGGADLRGRPDRELSMAICRIAELAGPGGLGDEDSSVTTTQCALDFTDRVAGQLKSPSGP
jgi:hypothetical protein